LNDDLYVSYVGDSAAVLVQNDEVIELCPELDIVEGNEKEVERIQRANGIVLNVGCTMRVQGELAITRSLGALKYKPYVVADPHVHKYSLKGGEDSFLVVASDGLWKALSNADIAKVVSENKNEEEIANKLYEEAINKNATDNISIIVVNIGKRNKLLLEETCNNSSSNTKEINHYS
jgi:serine/threonine protein phosphatase PrpC